MSTKVARVTRYVELAQVVEFVDDYNTIIGNRRNIIIVRKTSLG